VADRAAGAPGLEHSRRAEAAGGAAAEPIWAGHAGRCRARPKAQARRVWVSLALAATLLLCGGGAVSAYFCCATPTTAGSPDPATAVNRFLTAVYTQQDAAGRTTGLPRGPRQGRSSPTGSRDQELRERYEDPSSAGTEPAVASSGEDRAVVSVQLTLSTGGREDGQAGPRVHR
jgi:hypothetical protein